MPAAALDTVTATSAPAIPAESTSLIANAQNSAESPIDDPANGPRSVATAQNAQGERPKSPASSAQNTQNATMAASADASSTLPLVSGDYSAYSVRAARNAAAMNAATAAVSNYAIPSLTVPGPAAQAPAQGRKPQEYGAQPSYGIQSHTAQGNGSQTYPAQGHGFQSHASRNFGSPGLIVPASNNGYDVAYTPRGSHGMYAAYGAGASGMARGASMAGAGTGAGMMGASMFRPASLSRGHSTQRPRVLAIAGTDPTGGAGILADMKSIMACGGYGMGVVTSVVAQNTCAVSGIWPQPAEAITAQLQAVSSDVSIDAIKIGMMGTADAINAVHEWLETTDFTQMGGLWRKSRRKKEATGVITTPIPQRTAGAQGTPGANGAQDSSEQGGARLADDAPISAQEAAALADAANAGAASAANSGATDPATTDSGGRPIAAYHGMTQQVSGKQRPWTVLDPVMISTSGTRLLDPAAEGALAELLTSGLIDVLTPNLPELAALVGMPEAQTWEEAVEQGTKLLTKLGGTTRIYVKTGHLEGSTSRADAFIDACTMRAISRNPVVTRLPGIKIDTRNTHGTGCALSSALATFRPQCKDWLEAAQRSKAWIRGTIKHADELGVGLGNGPINHAWNLVDSMPLEDVPHQSVPSGVLRRDI